MRDEDELFAELIIRGITLFRLIYNGNDAQAIAAHKQDLVNLIREARQAGN